MSQYSVKDVPQFQVKVEVTKKRWDEEGFPRLTTKIGEKRLLVFEVKDPQLAHTTLGAVAYLQEDLELLPGLSWESMGLVGTGGYIRTQRVVDYLQQLTDTVESGKWNHPSDPTLNHVMIADHLFKESEKLSASDPDHPLNTME